MILSRDETNYKKSRHLATTPLVSPRNDSRGTAFLIGRAWGNFISTKLLQLLKRCVPSNCFIGDISYKVFLISAQEEEIEDPELDYKLRRPCKKMIKVSRSLSNLQVPRVTNINFLLTISIHHQEKRLGELLK